MEKFSVGSVQDWTVGKCRLVTAGEVEIGVVRLGQDYKAYRNVCPHAGAPVFLGPISQEGGQWLVHCPWHWWQFDLATGATPVAPGCALEAYAVEVLNDEVYVWA